MLPGAAGHAAQTSPRGMSVILDWLHLITGSLWLGGLIGLLVLWTSCAARRSGSAACRSWYRGSRTVAFVSVLILLARPGRRRDDQPHAGAERAVADRLRRRDPGQDRAADRRDGARRRQPAAHQTPTAAAEQRGPSSVSPPPAARDDSSAARPLIIAGGVRGRRALQSRAAAAGVRAAELGARERRTRPGRTNSHTRGIHACKSWSPRTRPPPPIPSRCGSAKTGNPSAARA